ncbi:hypothetical protein HC761_01870 [bacterium]|nr:hypothetical protein [bacterium]
MKIELFWRRETPYSSSSFCLKPIVPTSLAETSRNLLRQLSQLLQDWVSSDAMAVSKQFDALTHAAIELGAKDLADVSKTLSKSLLVYVPKAPTEQARGRIIELGHKLKACAQAPCARS